MLATKVLLLFLFVLVFFVLHIFVLSFVLGSVASVSVRLLFSWYWLLVTLLLLLFDSFVAGGGVDTGNTVAATVCFCW